MAMTTGNGSGVRSDINITPLVDVVLVLLIIFMVAVPILRVGYDSRVPPKSLGHEPDGLSNQIVLRLTADGALFINSERVEPGSFARRVGEVMKGRESQVAFLAASGTVPYQKVMAFVDLCHTAGASNLGIVVDEL
ncbi:MAG: biopolymer transporter ExbD [Thermoanaerobaculaceae bacterium]|jgi:biopolymer transport protein ExbD|nr:biopolymer transporter ExbD [Thermoanaerobaculaceae bacterium]